MSFKVGDKVRCIDSTDWKGFLEEGNIYEILDLAEEQVYVCTNNNGNSWFSGARFEPVAQADSQAAEVALLELYCALGDWRGKALEALEYLKESNDSTNINRIIDYTVFATTISNCDRARALVEKEVKNIMKEAAAREGL